MVALTFDGRAIRLSQNGLHFIWFQIGRRSDRRSFSGNVQDFGALLDCSWFPTSDKAKEAAQGRQAAVACADGVSAVLLGIVQESTHLAGRKVGQ